MNLWRVELARLLRTNRWMLLAGVFVTFGLLGPLSARYLGEIIARFGGEIEVTFPDPKPIDGIAQFAANWSQLGVLAVVIVAASALAIDARPEISAFYRTRVENAWQVVAPRYWVPLAASALSLIVGTFMAVIATEILIGPLDTVGVALGTGLAVIYLGFLVALVAAISTFTAGTTTTIFAALATAIAIPAVGLIAAVEPWLPSELVGAAMDLASDAEPLDFLRSTVSALASTTLLLRVAVLRIDRREI